MPELILKLVSQHLRQVPTRPPIPVGLRTHSWQRTHDAEPKTKWEKNTLQIISCTTHTHTHTHTHILHMYTHRHTHLHIHMHVHIRTHANTHQHICAAGNRSKYHNFDIRELRPKAICHVTWSGYTCNMFSNIHFTCTRTQTDTHTLHIHTQNTTCTHKYIYTYLCIHISTHAKLQTHTPTHIYSRQYI